MESSRIKLSPFAEISRVCDEIFIHLTLVSLNNRDSELKLYDPYSRVKIPLKCSDFPIITFCSLASALGLGTTPVVGSATHFSTRQLNCHSIARAQIFWFLQEN
jgi:hypothetical protein